MLITYKEFISNSEFAANTDLDHWLVLDDPRVSTAPDCILYLQPEFIMHEANYHAMLSFLGASPEKVSDRPTELSPHVFLLDQQYLVFDSRTEDVNDTVLSLLASLDDYPLLNDEVYSRLLEEYGYVDDPEFGIISKLDA